MGAGAPRLLRHRLGSLIFAMSRSSSGVESVP